MSTELAALKADANLAQAHQQLRDLRVWIESETDGALLADAIDRLRLAQEWIKLKRVGEVMAREAVRLECIALRRIAQQGKGALELIPPAERTVARGFASMTAARFAEMLSTLDKVVRPCTLHQREAEIDRWAHQMNRGYDIAAGGVSGDLAEEQAAQAAHELDRAERTARRGRPTKREIKEREYSESTERERDSRVTDSLNTLLTDLYAQGDPFSVSDATDALVESLTRSESWIYSQGQDDPRMPYMFSSSSDLDPAIREGLSEAIRHALRTAAAVDTNSAERTLGGYLGDDGTKISVPGFVTYQDPEAGWSRIPWHMATIEQLREMSMTRDRQAEHLAARAAESRALLAVIEQRKESHPKVRLCSTLLNSRRLSRKDVAA